jgi:hypothetical protein
MAAAGLAMSVLVVTGCSSPSINVATLEDELASQIADQRGVDAASVEVVCPTPIEVAEGSVVECMSSVDGESFTVLVAQTDDKGTMEWVLRPDDEPADAPVDAPADAPVEAPPAN